MIRRCLELLLILPWALWALPVQAQSPSPAAPPPPQYRVELLIFAHSPGASAVSEVFLAEPDPEPPDPDRILSEIDLSFTHRPDWLEILRAEREDGPAQATLEEIVLPPYRQVLSPEHNQLTAIQQRLQRQQGYRLLMQMSWEQSADVDAEALVIDLRDAVLGSPELLGTVALSRSRFLHLNLNLEYVPADRGAPSLLTTPDNPLADVRLQIPRYRMAESRRLRNGEIHYFDHPAFGVIAVVTAVSGRATDTGSDR